MRRFLLILFLVLFSQSAEATYRNRLSLMPGIIKLYDSDNSKVEFGAEVEHRLRRWIGIGAMGNYVMSNPRTTVVGAPEFFFHPGEGNWFFNVSPILQFREGSSTKFGLRLGSRWLIPMWLLRIGPVFDYDFIGGRSQYLIGIGLEIHTI